MIDAKEILERVQRGMIEAEGIIPVITADHRIELQHVDEDRRLISFATLDFTQAGLLVDTLNNMRRQLVASHGFAQVGHA